MGLYKGLKKANYDFLSPNYDFLSPNYDFLSPNYDFLLFMS